MHAKDGNPASCMAFAMFQALSRSLTVWQSDITISLGICHMLSYFVISAATVCELWNSCACNTPLQNWKLMSIH